jgi:hypothetical protein
MSTQHDRPPVLARDAEPGGGASGRSPRRDVGEDPLIPPDAEPEATVERILRLLSKSSYREARALAAAALARFPDHGRVQWAWDIFEIRGKATVSEDGPEPPRDQEFAWLRDPPDWARGKWVALVGPEAVAVGETLAEVSASVRSQKLARRPLVHRIG